MDLITFQMLLPMQESKTLDFKAEVYDFASNDDKQRERKRALFIKDIISMYNTPREEDSYILLGVKKYPSGQYDLLGVEEHPDDADLQGKFDTIVHPQPQFEYSVIEHDGLRFGVVTIPRNSSTGPCVPLKDVQQVLLKRNQVYIRRGSQNSEADTEEQRCVYRWFSGTSTKTQIQATGDGTWDSLLSAVENFSSAYRYVLLVPRLDPSEGVPIENLGLVDWGLVLDFDPESDLSGSLKASEKLLERRRAIHRLAGNDRARMRPDQATYWYFAQGLSGRMQSPRDGSWRSWYAAFQRDIQNHVEDLARSDVGKPVIVIAALDDADHLEQYESVFDIFVSCFGEAVRIVGVDCSKNNLTFRPKYNAVVIPIPLPQFLHGLGQIQHPESAESVITFPSLSGSPIAFHKDATPWLTEDLEAVHMGVGQRPPADRVPERDFLRGHEVTWYDLALNCDVSRDILHRVETTVRSGLEHREAARINVFHAPGAGGTTLSRRLLWNLRRHFPSLILKACVPEETVERIGQICGLTGKAVCLVAETSVVSEGDLDKLFTLIRARHLPVAIVQVGRRLGKTVDSARSFFLPSVLSNQERDAFSHFLSRAVPEKRMQILKFAGSNRPEFHTPFFLALTAFDSDFVGLDRYVKDRVESLNATQQRALIFFCLAHYYGQMAIPSQMFAVDLGLPASKAVEIDRALPDSVLELLIQDQPGLWRPRHYLISKAILECLLTSGGDVRTWKQQLSYWAREFATFCYDATETVLDHSMQMVLRCFLFRDSSDVLGTERAGTTKFAQLIEDVPEDNGRLGVLRHLADLFPDEAHVWAHLGRFYAYRLKEHALSLEAIDRALDIRPDDNVLHHMRGMALRAVVYDQMQQRGELQTIIGTVADASTSFATARSLDSEDEHGYISEVQMLLRVLDYIGTESGKSAIAVMTVSSNTEPLLREAFQAIEDLLAQVRQIRLGEAASRYEEDCRAKLDVLYGRHEEALQGWQNLLDRKGVYAPPIRRQIVWTLLARQGRDWEKLSQREIERSVELLRENITEEPGEPRNMRLWMQGIRRLTSPPNLEVILEQIAYWRANAESLESAYYTYVVNMLLALDGSALALNRAEKALEDSKARSASMRNRTRSFEWIGNGHGIRRLVHQDRLGPWNNELQFFAKTDSLTRVQGVISAIKKPEAGQIELSGGVKAFFVPGHSNHSKGIDENRRVTCLLGFSYDGPRAWDVKNL